MTIGIDVFEGNRDFDWDSAVARGNLGFAGVRATEGTHRDTKYQTYRAALKARGIPAFAYGLLRFEQSGPSPEDQGKALLDAIGVSAHLGTELTPVIDLEFPGGRHKYGITAQEALAWFLRCYRTVKAGLGGADPGIYTSYVVWVDPDGMHNIPCPEIIGAWSWMKQWPYPVGSSAVFLYQTVNSLGAPRVAPPFDGAWLMHQYQGDAVGYPGSRATKVDMNRTRVVSFSEKSATVQWIQRKLGIVVDGDFGPETDAAVRAFQASHGLVADGAVGLLTSACLSRVRS